MTATALSAAVDKYLVELKVPMRPSTNRKVGSNSQHFRSFPFLCCNLTAFSLQAAALHKELRNFVMMAVDMDVLLQQKRFEKEIYEIQIDEIEEVTGTKAPVMDDKSRIKLEPEN